MGTIQRAFQVQTAPAAEPIDLLEAKLQCRIESSNTYEDSLLSAYITHAREAAEDICRRGFVMQRMTLVMDRFPAPGMEFSSANWYGPQWGIGPGPLSTLKPDGTTGFEIFLPRCPVAKVESVKYIDTNGVTQTMVAGTDYIVDLVREPSRIAPAFNTSWPSTQAIQNAVTITYIVGWLHPVVADANANTLTVQGAAVMPSVNDAVRVSNSGGALPAPLKVKTDYYVQSVNGQAITLSLTPGGGVIDLTDVGSGTNFLGDGLPESIRAWMKLRIGTMFSNREEVAILHRGIVGELPYVDTLLSAHRVYTF